MNQTPQRLPGFTAEASLRATGARYRARAAAEGAAGAETKQSVVPALAPLWWCRLVGRACQLSGIGCEAWGACLADL